MSTSRRTNWAGNLMYNTDRLHLPASIAEAQDIVKGCRKIRPLGSSHSFNTIADSFENQISLERLNRVVQLDRQAGQVTIEAGIRYGELCAFLHGNGHALHNLASLPHISVAGACATATHGSGVHNGNLATAVSSIEFIASDGELIAFSREENDTWFPGAVVALGALGVITRLTLDVRPAFEMQQFVYQHLPHSDLNDHFEEIMGSAYSVSLFTDWQGDTINQVWIKRLAGDDAFEPLPTFFGARLASKNVHPILDHPAKYCTEQTGIPGPWHERLPHFRMEFTPSSGEELQVEYFVPFEHARDVIHVLQSLGRRLAPVLMISEIRAIAADNLWMSPCYQQPCAAFHFTCVRDWNSLQEVLPVIEDALEPYEPRPHWGKMFTMLPEKIQSRYERLADFKEMLREYDPESTFRNPFLDRVLGM